MAGRFSTNYCFDFNVLLKKIILTLITVFLNFSMLKNLMDDLCYIKGSRILNKFNRPYYCY